MKKFLYLFIVLLLLFGSFVAGTWYREQRTVTGKASGVKPQPLNHDTDTNTDTSSLPSGSVKISPEKQQAIGVQIGSVEKKPVTRTLRLLGRVAADETRIYRINAVVDGWITEAFPNRIGSLVKKDEVLASFYSTEAIAAQQSYFVYVLGGVGGPSQPAQVPGKEALLFGSPRTSVQQYRDSLKNLGMSEAQIEEIARTRQYAQRIHILSPATGFVLVRNVSQGERFEKGKELYRIADLSRVWILTDVFENEGSYLKAGMKVKVRLPNQNRTFQAKISDVLPQFDPATRTLKVGMEADNPGYILRPDMFVDVELPINLPPAITVPADAVLDSGLKRTVFVDLGNGFFEPREVETGWRLGDRVEITKGLKPGERIIISSTFLIDSESRLELAAAGMVGTLSKDPVCGGDVSINKAERAGRKSVCRGKTYYFSSDECKEKFDKDPEIYVKE